MDTARIYRARIDRAFDQAGLGLTSGEARTLAYIDLLPEPPRQSVLAERMNVEPMTVVAFLDRLEARDLVRREPDPRDRRAKIVTLTAEAETLLVAIKSAAAVAREDALRGLDEAERDMFLSILGRIRDNLTQDPLCAPKGASRAASPVPDPAS